MTNKRLSASDRDVLLAFAKKQVSATQDMSDVDTAYEKAADAIHAKILVDNPPKDMAVLKRYGLADLDRCIYISTGGYNYQQFTYREGDKRIVLRAYRRNGCNRHPIQLEGEGEQAFDAYLRAVKANEVDQASRLSNFKALIYNSRSFNDVATIWPAAEELRASIVGNGSALIVLSADVVDAIKADAAFEAA